MEPLWWYVCIVPCLKDKSFSGSEGKIICYRSCSDGMQIQAGLQRGCRSLCLGSTCWWFDDIGIWMVSHTCGICRWMCAKVNWRLRCFVDISWVGFEFGIGRGIIWAGKIGFKGSRWLKSKGAILEGGLFGAEGFGASEPHCPFSWDQSCSISEVPSPAFDTHI